MCLQQELQHEKMNASNYSETTMAMYSKVMDSTMTFEGVELLIDLIVDGKTYKKDMFFRDVYLYFSGPERGCFHFINWMDNPNRQGEQIPDQSKSFLIKSEDLFLFNKW